MKMLERVVNILMVAIMLWIGASWVDIIADNDYPNPHHSDYNFFIIMQEARR